MCTHNTCTYSLVQEIVIVECELKNLIITVQYTGLLDNVCTAMLYPAGGGREKRRKDSKIKLAINTL